MAYKDTAESSFNDLLATYKARAKKKKRKFTLSKSQFKLLTQGLCAYCGISPHRKHSPRKFRNAYVYNGIDRIDSSKGYTPKNSVSCCYDCNRTKSELSHSAFLSYLSRLVSNQLLILANKGAPTGETTHTKRKSKTR